MNWGEELWDQYGQLEKHTDKGIEFLDKYCHFVKERQRIEIEYASALKRLIKNYQPKKKETEDVTFSTVTSFKNILLELQGVANQHEVIAEDLITKVTKEVQGAIHEFKQERKKLLQDARSKEAAKDRSIKKLDQSKDTYRQAYNAFIAAKQQYEKVESDLNQSRAQLHKSKSNMNQKDQQREDAKNEYILQLAQTNKEQQDHYYNQLPSIFNKIQEMDENRILKISEYYKEYADCHRRVMPIIGKCLDCITQQAENVNPNEDSKKVTIKYKSGLVPPSDFQMMDLDDPPTEESESKADTVSGNSVSSANSSGGTITGKTKKTRRGLKIFSKAFSSVQQDPKDDDGLGRGSIRRLKIPHTPSFRRKPEPSEDFSHLQPAQQRRELQKKIDELQEKVDTEIKAKEAVLKMREVYTNTPSMGDPAQVEPKLTEIGTRLDSLRLELQKFQKFMGYTAYSNKETNSLPSNSTYQATAEGKTFTPQGTPKGTPQGTPHATPHSTPIADRAKAGSTQSLGGGEAGAEDQRSGSNQSSPTREPPRNEDATDHKVSPGESLTSPLSSRHESVYEDMDDEFEDHPQVKAKFPFHSEDENSLSMEIGDVLDVMEEDTGDGWTRVRKGDAEGFVPTSYLDFES